MAGHSRDDLRNRLRRRDSKLRGDILVEEVLDKNVIGPRCGERMDGLGESGSG